MPGSPALVDGGRIVSRGLSAGGLLQGAVYSRAPGRWRAVVAEVPFVDCVTTMLDPGIPLTINEWDEWGDPRDAGDFACLRSYSPYDNPPAGPRPDLLVTGAVHDPRVLVHEPAKWVARLRETDTSRLADPVPGGARRRRAHRAVRAVRPPALRGRGPRVRPRRHGPGRGLSSAPGPGILACGPPLAAWREESFMTDTLVQYSADRGIARVALDSPRNRNALSAALTDQLEQALADAAADPAVRAVELTHTGSTFCAGADLAEARAGGMASGTARLMALLRQILELPKPVVASIDGHVRAGGMGLVGACDIAIAGPASTFAFSEVKLALAPAIISLTTLPRLTARAAGRYYLTGETFGAAAAAAMGLITEAVDDIDAGP